jgi:hypothetical protein
MDNSSKVFGIFLVVMIGIMISVAYNNFANKKAQEENIKHQQIAMQKQAAADAVAQKMASLSAERQKEIELEQALKEAEAQRELLDIPDIRKPEAKARDAGKTCHDSSECQGLCIYNVDEKDAVQIEYVRNVIIKKLPTDGECSSFATKEPQGCIYEVFNSLIRGRKCYKDSSPVVTIEDKIKEKPAITSDKLEILSEEAAKAEEIEIQNKTPAASSKIIINSDEIEQQPATAP